VPVVRQWEHAISEKTITRDNYFEIMCIADNGRENGMKINYQWTLKGVAIEKANISGVHKSEEIEIPKKKFRGQILKIDNVNEDVQVGCLISNELGQSNELLFQVKIRGKTV
jgi:hypothetical protein